MWVPGGRDLVGKVAKRGNARSRSLSLKALAVKRTETAQARFLEALEGKGGGNVTLACRLAGIGRRTVYDWSAKDEKFTERMEEARAVGEEMRADELEAVLDKKALAGKSEIAAFFRLKGIRPHKYRDNAHLFGPHFHGPTAIKIFLDETPASSLPTNDGGPQPEAIDVTPENSEDS